MVQHPDRESSNVRARSLGEQASGHLEVAMNFQVGAQARRPTDAQAPRGCRAGAGLIWCNAAEYEMEDSSAGEKQASVAQLVAALSLSTDRQNVLKRSKARVARRDALR
ncbi:hypothetical protein AB1Y20_000826 [Prymnesium parvum]|uniref:Uncharacterized protein n=1 Tax=Prymnesium parvum TaxID=97485 RepID=A0AB34K9G1_PRYPA